MDDLEDELARRAAERRLARSAERSTRASSGTEPSDRSSPATTRAWSGCRSCSPSPGSPARRKCEELMLAGLVEVDGEVVTRLGTKVDPTHRGDPGRRQAAAADQPARLPGAEQAARRRLHDVRPQGRRRSRDYVADRPERLFHVGRLDTDTAGLILLTNDGDFAHRMAHPSYEVDKTYVAEVDGRGHQGTVQQLLAGVTLEDGPVDGQRRPSSCGQRTATARSSSWSSTRAATASSAGCSTTSATRSAQLTRTAIGPVGLRPGSGSRRAARAAPSTSSARCWTPPALDAAGGSSEGRARGSAGGARSDPAR